jgi:hypothetical protein
VAVDNLRMDNDRHLAIEDLAEFLDLSAAVGLTFGPSSSRADVSPGTPHTSGTAIHSGRGLI